MKKLYKSILNYLESIVGPTSKLHLTVLIIKGEPSDVNFTSGHEDPWRNVGTTAATRYDNICRIGPVKCFAGTERRKRVQLNLKMLVLAKFTGSRLKFLAQILLRWLLVSFCAMTQTK